MRNKRAGGLAYILDVLSHNLLPVVVFFDQPDQLIHGFFLFSPLFSKVVFSALNCLLIGHFVFDLGDPNGENIKYFNNPLMLITY